MHYLLAYATDAGIKKNRNQDSILIKQAVWKGNPVVLSAVCDGMGGLMQGEVASASLIRAFSGWMDQKLPELLLRRHTGQAVFRSWRNLLTDMNRRIGAYGKRYHIQLGTTVTAVLFVKNRYYTVHVGDSRAYEIANRSRQLTRDQTLVQQEMERGNLTREEAGRDVRRNVLLQCVGASDQVIPACGTGKIRKDAVYVICSDGFYRAVRESEMKEALDPEILKKESVMERRLEDLIRVCRQRGEQDNISALAVRTCKRRDKC